ncbi:SkfA peptide export ATP-binding protein SkfE [Candidatus Methanoperedenaceae archaeon GB37]|nr:SkfA peptide export ATP-binding protein SkfE [Candidatus Methanoperedenaceae archaeon GB37]
MSLIVFKQITKSYQEGLRRKKQVLKGLSLEIKKGEVFGFLGPNGAGKSTTIKILLNFIFPDKGEVRINGQPVSNPQVRKISGVSTGKSLFI